MPDCSVMEVSNSLDVMSSTNAVLHFLVSFCKFFLCLLLLSFEYLTLHPCLLSVFVYSYLFGL